MPGIGKKGKEKKQNIFNLLTFMGSCSHVQSETPAELLENVVNLFFI